MVPVKFKGVNNVLARSSKGVEPTISVPVRSDDVVSTSCWKMSFRERLNAALFGKVWISVMIEGDQPPLWPQTNRNIFKS